MRTGIEKAAPNSFDRITSTVYNFHVIERFRTIVVICAKEGGNEKVEIGRATG